MKISASQRKRISTSILYYLPFITLIHTLALLVGCENVGISYVLLRYLERITVEYDKVSVLALLERALDILLVILVCRLYSD